MKQVVQTTFGVPLKDSDLAFMVDILNQTECVHILRYPFYMITISGSISQFRRICFYPSIVPVARSESDLPVKPT
jgi:hypothetical protein